MATQIQRKSAPRPRPKARGATAPAKERAKESWRSITVDATPEDCYRLWRDVATLPRFLSFVESIQPNGGSWSHWIGKGDDGEKTVGWDADLVRDEPGRALSWRPLAHGTEPVALSLRFDRASGGRGTVVRLNLARKEKPDRTRAIRELHRFKQWKETGEIATIEGQSSGRRGPMGRLIRKGEQ